MSVLDESDNLVGGFNPSEKYARQIGNLPQVSGENKKYLKPSPSNQLEAVHCINFAATASENSSMALTPDLTNKTTVDVGRMYGYTDYMKGYLCRFDVKKYTCLVL